MAKSSVEQLAEVLRRLGDEEGATAERESEILSEIKARKHSFAAAVDRTWKQTLPVDGDVNRGASLFSRHCLGCHSLEQSWRHGRSLGPSLASVFGRVAGGDPGYAYPTLYAPLDFRWDRRRLTDYLRSPTAFMGGTVGCDSSSLASLQRSEADIADVVEFLYRMGKASVRGARHP